MKTVFKRLLSFVLVAMMLVSAVPFQASANTTYDVTIDLYEDGIWTSYIGREHVTLTGKTTVTYNQLYEALDGNYDSNKYEFVEFTLDGDSEPLDEDATITLDGTNIRYSAVFKKLPEKFDVEITYEVNDEDEVKVTMSDVTSFDDDDVEEFLRDEKNMNDQAGVVSYVFDVDISGKKADVKITKYDEMSVRFIDEKTGVDETINTKYGVLPKLPSSPKAVGYEFEGWFASVSGKDPKAVKGEEPGVDTFYAHWDKNADKDGMSTITVYAKFYAEDSVVERFTLIKDEPVEDGTKILEWLMTKKNTILDELEGLDNYDWDDFDFYDNSTNEPLTQQDEVADGNRYIYVKLDAEDVARVLVCVHNKLGSKGTYYKLDGYVAGTYILKSDVVDFVKSKYNVSSKNINGLYGEAEWKQLVNDEDVKGVTSYEVDNNDTTVVHVLLKDATLKGSSNNDDSNPKTGDTIMMAVTILGLSASALAVLYFLNKKKAV